MADPHILFVWDFLSNAGAFLRSSLVRRPGSALMPANAFRYFIHLLSIVFGVVRLNVAGRAGSALPVTRENGANSKVHSSQKES